MNRQPEIYFSPTRRAIVTKVHDHSLKWEPFALINCPDPNCRQELIRMGGVECVRRKWFAARDRTSFNIPQPDGSTHLHEPHGKDYSIECSSPGCSEFFLLPASANDVSPKEETRPKTGAELGEIEKAFRERARLEAEIEIEKARQLRAALFPLPR